MPTTRPSESLAGDKAPHLGRYAAGPWAIVGRAVAWTVLSLIGGVITSVIAAGLTGAAAAVIGFRISPVLFGRIGGDAYTLGMPICLLWLAVRSGRAAGGGDLALGLANHPIQRRGILNRLAIGTVVLVAAFLGFVLWLVALGLPVPTDQASAMPADAAGVVVRLLSVLVLAPVAEELFFRGWFWTALRTFWGPRACFAATGGLWLLIHAAPGNPFRPLVLLPIAILLSIVRHKCQSVRAAIILHFINNLAITSVQMLLAVITLG